MREMIASQIAPLNILFTLNKENNGHAWTRTIASNELFQQALAKPGQNIFNLKLQCPPGRRMQQWHPKDFWENITMLSRDPLTLNNFHLSWRPEPRQNFKSLHDKQQSRWEFSFIQRFMARSHRTEQYGKVMVKLNYINSRWNYITCTFKITLGFPDQKDWIIHR